MITKGDADRDRIWCRALIATLNTEDIERVTAEFNRICPDAAEQAAAPDAASLGCRVCGEPVWDITVGVCWYHQNNPAGG